MGTERSKHQTSKHKDDHTLGRHYYERVDQTKSELPRPKLCTEVKLKIAKETSGTVNNTNKYINTYKSEASATVVQQYCGKINMNIQPNTTEFSEHTRYVPMSSVDTSQSVTDLSTESEEETIKEGPKVVYSEVKPKIAKETSGTVKKTDEDIHNYKSEQTQYVPMSSVDTSQSVTDLSTESEEETIKEDFPLVIALHFGTSYSGYGYQFLDEYQKHPMDISIPQAFNGFKQYFLSPKTSTCILIKTSGEVEYFGYLAEERYEEICLSNEHEQFYFFKHFKMKLHEMKGLHTDFLLPDETGTKELPATVVFSLAIKSLMDHAIKYISNERGTILESSILWALTVPAIWNESATQFMKDAAVKAGIKRENLKIVYEPEAASFACRYLPVSTLKQTIYKPRFFEVPIGTLYMVVDLGGGTADIVIHKKIDQRRVKEISRPSGGPWGGTAVDSNFTSFLIKIVGAKVFMKFKHKFPGDYFDLMQEFEVKKRNVEQGMTNKIHIRMPSELSNICRNVTGKDLWSTVQETEYCHKIQFTGDKALIDSEIFYGFFEPVAKEIVEHVKIILDSRHGSKVALLLMVGGFSESKYIQNVMKSEFQRDTMDVLIPKDPGLTVIKGAVFLAREEKLLAFRVRNVICVAAVHVGRNTTTMAIQFRDTFLHNPYEVFEVMFLDSNRMPIKHNSTCVLFDQTMNVHSVGNEAEEKYQQLCFLSKEKEWHFFKDFHLQLEEQEDNIELTLTDQDNIPMKAIDILSTYISHALKHLENIYRQQDVLSLMQDTHFVFTAPADWSERECIRILSDAAEMAGFKEERISVILESEAINQYCKKSKAWKNLNVAGSPIGSIIVICKLSRGKG